jgi:hypothetical protein
MSHNGFSARRKAIHRIGGKQFVFIPFVFLLCAVLLACNQVSNGQANAANAVDSTIARADSMPEPKVNIHVNKRFDDKGNLIAFDSVYSKFYSSMAGDTTRMDSMMRSFDSYFGLHHKSLFDHDFNSLFFTDSLRYPDFFHDDFFLKRYELNDNYLRDMMRRMDSIKNKFHRPTNPERKGEKVSGVESSQS